MKRKIILLLSIITVMLFMKIDTKASVVEWEDSFYDDFSSYDVGKVEEMDDFKDVWTNHDWSGTESNSTDISDVATIKQDGTDKFLNMNYEGSFFYMAPKDFRAKNLSTEFTFRSHEFETDGWIGVSVRKEYRDIRYNGGTGLMFYFRTAYLYNESEEIVGERIRIQALRGGSMSVTDLTPDFIDAEGRTGSEAVLYQDYIYPTDGSPIDSEKQIKGNWQTVQITVSETENTNEGKYEVTINNELIGTLIHARGALNVHGYVSLHSCLSNMDVNEFKVDSLDTTPPPPIVRVNRLIAQTASVNDVFELPGEEEGDIEVIGAVDDTYSIEVITPEGTTSVLDSGVYEFTPTMAGIYTIRYVAVNSFELETVFEHAISVSALDTDDEDDIDDEDDVVEEDDNIEDDKKNNTTTIIIISSVVVIGIAGGLVYFIKRK